ncbi:hypothetical protein LZL87_014225 [Fusarium oxysporum]|nr:hypothetical protein LZL87_014225 [Fusarium oxysporum]
MPRFLLAQLHRESLIDNMSVKAIRSALLKLPSGSDAYDYAYETAIERIEKQPPGHRSLAKQLRHALAVEVSTTEIDIDALPETEDMVMICVGLVTVDEQSDIIRLVHYTAQQYFDKSWGKWFTNAEGDITATCVTYLSFDVFESGFCRTDEEFEERMRLNPFYDYSAHYWGNHAHDAPTLCQEAIDFLKCNTKVESSSQPLMAIKRSLAWTGYSQEVPRQMTGLHLVAYFGIRNGAQMLISRDDADLMDSYGRTPLSYAAEKGHEAIVKLFLDTGQVNVDAKDQSGRTSLSWACERGHEAMAKLLLKTGQVDVDAKDDNGGTPLSWGAAEGHEAIVKLLLATGQVDVDAQLRVRIGISIFLP